MFKKFYCLFFVMMLIEKLFFFYLKTSISSSFMVDGCCCLEEKKQSMINDVMLTTMMMMMKKFFTIGKKLIHHTHWRMKRRVFFLSFFSLSFNHQFFRCVYIFWALCVNGAIIIIHRARDNIFFWCPYTIIIRIINYGSIRRQ